MNWEYDITKFAEAPPEQCYSLALQHKALQVKNIKNTIIDMQNALIAGYPFVFGIKVFDSFDTQAVMTSGKVPMPDPSENCLGGHALVCVGFDDYDEHWIFRNSWGAQFGENGYGYLPYAYLLDSSLASDLWCVQRIQA